MIQRDFLNEEITYSRIHVAKFEVYVNQLSNGNNKTFFFFSLNLFTKMIHLIALNEMKIYYYFVEHVCMELWFIWENSNIVRYDRDTTDRVRLRTFFMGDYLFCKSFLLFLKSVLALPYYCLDITLKVLWSKCCKTIRLSIEQVSFWKEFFKYVIKNFTVTLFQNTLSLIVPWLHE